MTIINVNSDRIIQLGYEGEDKVTILRFSYSEKWLENGDGIFTVRVLRNGENKAYNAQMVDDDRENSTIDMTVTDVELSKKGYGEMQLVYTGADFVKKSPVYKYYVSRSVDDAVDPPAQDVYTQIIESLSDLQTDVQGLSDAVDGIGNLAELTTMAKTDLVSAINEVNEHGGSSVTVDSALSDTSENPVQNKTITGAIREVSSYARDLSGVIDGLGEDVEGLETALRTKADIQTVSALADAVQGLDGDVQDLQTTVQAKADTATVTALSGTVSGLQTSKADKSYVDTQLAGKASTATATTSADGLMSSADKAKLDMVGSVVTVSGTAPVITAVSGVRYVCGEVATLDFTPCATGICDVVFTSGSTPTVVILPNTVKFSDGSFTAEANKTYEINILDGVYGVVMSWT